jgi:hypothetical protein
MMIRNLVCLAIEGGELDLGGDLRVGDGDVELEGELVAAEVVDVPAGALPAGALRVGGGDAEPVVVLGLVHRGVGDEGAVLLLEPLPPRIAVARTRPRRQQRDLAHHALRALVPALHGICSSSLCRFRFPLLRRLDLRLCSILPRGSDARRM